MNINKLSHIGEVSIPLKLMMCSQFSFNVCMCINQCQKFINTHIHTMSTIFLY